MAGDETARQDIAGKIERLRARLRDADRAYYVEASPVMSDRAYDAEMAELSQLEAEHPEFDDPASPTRRVGGEPIEGFETLPHAVRMLSIENTYTAGEVGTWVDRMHRRLAEAGHAAANTDAVVFACDPKIDGVALSLRYESGRLVRALTRGDGTKGDDVTHAARTIRSDPAGACWRRAAGLGGPR